MLWSPITQTHSGHCLAPSTPCPPPRFAIADLEGDTSAAGLVGTSTLAICMQRYEGSLADWQETLM